MSGSSGSRTTVIQRALVALQVFLLLATLIGPAAVMANEPSAEPTPAPSAEPSAEPSVEPTPSAEPSAAPTAEPSAEPTAAPTPEPTLAPEPTPATPAPTVPPTAEPTSIAAPAYAPSGSPSIASDLADYPPGGTVTLTGSNWFAGESVHIFVNDDIGTTWSRNVDVTADASGRISDVFNLPDWFIATYRVVATGETSGTATATFTDGNVRARSNANGIVFALNWVEYDSSQNCTGTVDDSGSDSTVGFAPGGGSGLFSQGVPNQNSITLQAAATSNAGLVFAGWTGETASDTFIALPNRTICVPGNFTGSRTYVANYVANTAPVANNDAYSVAEDGTLTVAAPGVLANDTDANGHALTVATPRPVSGPTNGSLTLNANGSFTYTPNANFNGSDSFTYRASDGFANSTLATVAITATAVDDAPVAVNDSATVGEDSGANTIDVLANDTDIDGGPKSVASVTQPANGTVAITGGGTGVSYTPNANFCGSNSFTYTLNGGSTATVSVTVTCVDDAPVAVNDAATVAEDSGANAIDVLANDTDIDGGPKSVASVTQPANGTVAITGGGTGVSYTPNANFCGSNSFTYTLNGGSTATVSVTVTCVNDDPVANDDAATVAEDSGANAIDVLANDNDGPDVGETLTVTAVTQGTNGSVTFTAAGVSYTPNANFFGSDSFTYTISDGNGGSDTATVTVTVSEVNDPVDAVNDAASVDEDDAGGILIDVAANDTRGPANESTQTLTISDISIPAHGTAVLEAGEIRYTPTDPNFNGTDSFTYKITDNGTTNGIAAPSSDTATVTITVVPVNDAPVVSLSGAAAVFEGSDHTYSFTTSDVDSGDTFVLGATVCGTGGSQVGGDTFNSTTGAGSFVCSFPDGPATPTVSVTVSDDDGASDSDTVDVTVSNVAPIALTASITVNPVSGEIKSTLTYSDVGVNDTQTARFEYRLDGVLVRTNTSSSALPSSGTATDSYFAAPGCYTIEVTMWVTDKDGASSARLVATGATSDVDIYAASFKAPIKDNERNIAKYGNVVPIKVELASSCSPGTTVTTPILHITIASGNVADVVPDSTPVIVAESVSNADTGTQMRVNGGGYIYNFTTKNLTAGQDYTIRIRVGSTIGPIILRALFQPKK